jgi:hypothetical protein
VAFAEKNTLLYQIGIDWEEFSSFVIEKGKRKKIFLLIFF